MIAYSAANALLRFDPGAFGRLLIDRGELADVDWRLAEEVARQNGHTAIRAVLDLGLLSEDVLADALATWTDRPRWTFDPAEDDDAVILSDVVPREFMDVNNLLLLDAPDEGDDRSLRLICSDPSDRMLWRSLLAQMQRPLDVRIGTQKDIARFLSERAAPVEAASPDSEDGQLDVTAEISQLRDMASEAPVIRFFNQAIERAMEIGASDVHLERFDHRPSLRMRVDGMLIEHPAPQARMYEALLCRIKIMAGLDIAERRKPQDGRIRMRLRGRMVDLRVSLVPTMYGQDAAMRLQDRQMLGDVTLPQLGFTSEQIEQLFHTASKSHGILLVTGPTGSGKTTTLYALLRQLVGIERKVVTVEDPVEYAMDGVNQIQVNPAIGLTFSNTLRHILRHDPDVILIGEIRDHETAEMAFQAALTGHMVLSTLHTNDVAGTFVRLIDMGVEPYLVNAAVEGVTAQRLLRKVCTECRNQAPAREGCKNCGGLGYRGRIALMEFSGVSGEVKRAIREGADERQLRDILETTSFRSLRDHAVDYVAAGVTDEAEVARVIGHPELADLGADVLRASDGGRA